jgi:hypothetical protein
MILSIVSSLRVTPSRSPLHPISHLFSRDHAACAATRGVSRRHLPRLAAPSPRLLYHLNFSHRRESPRLRRVAPPGPPASAAARLPRPYDPVASQTAPSPLPHLHERRGRTDGSPSRSALTSRQPMMVASTRRPSPNGLVRTQS